MNNSLPARFSRFILWLWENNKFFFFYSSILVAVTISQALNGNFEAAFLLGVITCELIWSQAKSEALDRLVKIIRLQASVIKNHEEKDQLYEKRAQIQTEMCDKYKEFTDSLVSDSKSVNRWN